MTVSLHSAEQRELEVPADLAELSRIRRHLREACGLLAVSDPEFINELELAVVETVTNVIRHSCQGGTGQQLIHRVSRCEDELQYAVTHNGDAFDSDSADVPDEIEPAEGGMGLFIIRQCVDAVTYESTDDGRQRITLSKKLAKAT